MPVDERFADLDRAVAASGLLGYLNFSQGKPDPRWQRQLNDAYAFLAGHDVAEPWNELVGWLVVKLEALRASGAGAFRDVTQASALLTLLPRVLAAYRQH